MNKKISLGACVALMAIIATITLSITYVLSMNAFNDRVHNVYERQRMYEKLSEVDQKVRQNFLGAIDDKSLNDALADGYMKGSGDRYGSYLSAEKYKSTLSDLEGRTVGIGATIRQNADESILVIGVNPGSPAATAGLMVGDVITALDKKSIEAMTFEEIYETMQGAAGSKISLVVKREDADKTFDIIRKEYEIISVEHRVIKQNVGYVKITEFNDNTTKQFTDAVRDLQNKEVIGIVFDLRDNPGGTLESVANMLNLLLPAGNIVSSTDKDGKTTVLYTSDPLTVKLPMSVIMNGDTASAAELFAAALKDYRMATLVGTTSRGKGTMQKMFPLTDGSVLNITVAKFNPPSSENFDEVGLTPDIENTLTEEQIYDFHKLTEDTDPQLLAAVNALALTGADPDAIGVPNPETSEIDTSSGDDDPDDSSGLPSNAGSSGTESSSPSAPSSGTESSSGGAPGSPGSSSGATGANAFFFEGRKIRFV